MRVVLISTLLALTVLAGCGFKLRGDEPLPFARATVVAAEGSVLAKGLRQALNAQAKLAAEGQPASLRIQVVEEKHSKEILSLSGAGKVREYRLTSQAKLIISNPAGAELVTPLQLEQVREYSFSDASVLAAEATEASLLRAMEQEMLRQAMRRLAYLKL